MPNYDPTDLYNQQPGNTSRTQTAGPILSMDDYPPPNQTINPMGGPIHPAIASYNKWQQDNAAVLGLQNEAAKWERGGLPEGYTPINQLGDTSSTPPPPATNQPVPGGTPGTPPPGPSGPPSTVMSSGGTGVIPDNGQIGPRSSPLGQAMATGKGITPSAGAEVGQSLPAAPAGGSNMRIMNGQRTQDIQFSPTGQGGVTATTMRDAATGLTFVQGPNGQFYPSGSQPSTTAGQAGMPGAGFGNAQTNIVGAGLDAAMAANAGVPLNPVTADALGRMRLAGVSPSSPVGQRMMNDAISQWNQSQTEIEKARIMAEPQMIAAKATAEQLGAKGKLAQAEIEADKEIDREYPGIDSARREAIKSKKMERYRKTMGLSDADKGGVAGTTPAPGAAGGGGAKGAIDNMNKVTSSNALDKLSKVAPDMAEQIGSIRNDPKAGIVPSVPIETMMQRLYLHDKQNPGFIRQHGQDVINAIQQAYGPDAVKDYAGLSFGNVAHAGLMGLIPFAPSIYKAVHTPSVEEQAQSAWRDALGMGGWHGGPASGFLKQ